MKRLFSIICTIAVFFATACQADKSFDSTIENNSNTITVSLEHTRTSLGAKYNDIYPVYWSEGDRLVVNGALSEAAQIDESNRSIAKFKVESSVTYPLSTVYPYSPSTTAEKPIVEFPAEQTYTENGFASGYAPMCGYATKSGEALSLSHLSTILRFPVKAALEGVVLDKVVITSTSGSKISGEFAVDCASAVITPTATAKNSITYTLPANYSLSTSETSIFYITLPATNVGICSIEFIDNSGKKMVATWSPGKPLDKGIVREFKEIVYKRQESCTLEMMPSEEDEFTIFYKKIYGNVRYSDGSPIAGVAVSDGFQVTSTDENGYYELNGVTPDTWYIYCSIPEDVKVPIDEFGRPNYFQKYPSSTQRYDFTFEKLAGGKEKEFALLALADTQVSHISHTDRYKVQASPEMKKFSQEIDIPCYGVALGDLVYCSATNPAEHLYYEMRDAFRLSGVPTFAVMGNHDNCHFSTTKPVFASERNSNYNLTIQRAFEECFGPINFSFNRGDVHIVGMRNMQWNTNIYPSGDKITLMFTDEQLEWLKQDLALVPKNKTIVFCVHIPIYNKTNKNLQETLTLLDQFAEVHILSGHLHFRNFYDHAAKGTGHKAFEQIWATMHGVGWGQNANICCDGSPSGYGVIVMKDGKMTKSLHKGFPYSMNDLNYQIRLHRGGDITGAEISGTNSNNTKGYYKFPYDNNVILANVFSSDPWYWTVEVWNYNEKTGKKTTKIGNMTSLNAYADTPEFKDLIGSFTYDDPKRPKDGANSGRDFWTAGVLCGYLGRPVSSNYHECHTMWKFTLSDPNAKVMVVAKDRWGNEFTQTEFQVGTDLGYAIYDANNNPK